MQDNLTKPVTLWRDPDFLKLSLRSCRCRQLVANGGIVADRFRLWPILIWTDLGRATVLAFIPVLYAQKSQDRLLEGDAKLTIDALVEWLGRDPFRSGTVCGPSGHWREVRLPQRPVSVPPLCFAHLECWLPLFGWSFHPFATFLKRRIRPSYPKSDV